MLTGQDAQIIMGRIKIKFRVHRIDGDDEGRRLLGDFSTGEEANAAIKTDSLRIIAELSREGFSGVPFLERTGPFVVFIPVPGHEFIYSIEMVF
jgi:hypothetical protein